MTAPFSVRVGQLVRLLGSDRDGEILASVHALDRLLRAAGLDWHDLALAVEAGLRTRPTPIHRPWQATAADLYRRGGGRLRAADMEFLASMRSWPTPPTLKQIKWLLDIEAALRGWAA